MYVDRDGEIAAQIIGAVVGGTANFVGQVAGLLVANHKVNTTLSEIIKQVDLLDVGLAAAEGALTCGMSVARKSAISLASNILQSSLDVTGNGISVNSAKEVVKQTAVSTVMNAIPVNIKGTHVFGKEVSNNKAVKAARDAANKDGKKLTVSQLKLIRASNTKKKSAIPKANNAMDKALSDAPGNAGGTFVNKVSQNDEDKKENK